MPFVTLIKSLDLPKEVCRKVINYSVEYIQRYWEWEYPEMVDLDLLYTFDNEVINQAYRYRPTEIWPAEGERHYRYCYYTFLQYLYPVRNWSMFGTDEGWSLYATLYGSDHRLDQETGEMPLVTWIKAANISRENMEYMVERAKHCFFNEEYDKEFLAANKGTEFLELPNLDIIYTFDNDLINEYYSLD